MIGIIRELHLVLLNARSAGVCLDEQWGVGPVLELGKLEHFSDEKTEVFGRMLVF